MDYIQKAQAYLSWKLLFILVTIGFLIAAIVYVYRNYLVPTMNPSYAPNKEFVDQDVDSYKEAEVLMFTVDWCPYCKKAKPEWEKIKEKYNERSINGYTVYFRTINCTDENDVEIKDLQNKYTIDGYPTIKLLKDGEVISYDAKPDFETLQKFLQTVLTH